MALTAALRDLNKLNAFLRVAERRSFTEAAADLRTTPSVRRSPTARSGEEEDAIRYRTESAATVQHAS